MHQELHKYPPSTDGNRASRTRCPVRRGVSAASFSATGLGVHTAKSTAWYTAF
nr:hypothetical protein MARPO_0042s0092 [Ipomoea batatas]